MYANIANSTTVVASPTVARPATVSILSDFDARRQRVKRPETPAGRHVDAVERSSVGIRNLGLHARVLLRAKEHRLDLPRWLIRRPLLGLAIGAAEGAETLSGRVDYRLKLLAQARVASMVGCEFCLDVGSALAQGAHVPDRQLLELSRFETSDAYSEVERLVLRLATALTSTPAVVPSGLRDDLVERLGKAGYLELAVAIAHEHQRTRLYLALGIRPAKFAPDGVCPIPPATSEEHPATVP